jgi:hypothetical protein
VGGFRMRRSIKLAPGIRLNVAPRTSRTEGSLYGTANADLRGIANLSLAHALASDLNDSTALTAFACFLEPVKDGIEDGRVFARRLNH